MRVILVAAVSLDGYIAQSREQVSTAWTSQEDKRWFAQLSREVGTVVLGEPTYRTIGKPLAGRKLVVLTENTRFVGDDVMTLEAAMTTGVYYCAGRRPRDVLALLADKGLARVIIGGGARVYQSFLVENLIDELYLTIEPVFLGGGVKLLPEDSLVTPQRFRGAEIIDLSDDVHVWHLVKKG